MCNKLIYSLVVVAALLIGANAQSGGSSSEGGGDRPISARAMQLAMAQGCEAGSYFYRMEEIVGGNRPRLEKVQYVCVDGRFRRNGFVPKYPARCSDGEDRMIPERQTWGNHERDVMVRYTCVGGRLKRNP